MTHAGANITAMQEPFDVGALVRRVAARVLAEQGRVRHPHGQPEVPGLERPGGVHVSVEGPAGADRPAQDEGSAPARRGAHFVGARELEGLAANSELAVPPGAIVTALARDEARARGIRIVERATSDAGRQRIALGADHGGFRLKGELAELLRSLGHVVLDVGTRDESPVDYPDFARAVAEQVARGDARFGIVIDGAGIGSAMAANKVAGVRAANCWDEASARNAREHNFANVLTLGARHLTAERARAIARTFLTTPEGEERHARRVAKISEIERRAAR
jgi:ribose 5-phosphate isomerase B